MSGIKSKRLLRQLKRHFQVDDLQLQQLSSSPDFANQMAEFLIEIDSTYQQLDSRNDLSARNLEISSEELDKLNTDLSAVMNSVGQGFMLIDSAGFCGPIYSKSCETLLETIPVGKNLFDILKSKEEKRSTDMAWLTMLFEDRIDFQDMAALGYSLFNHSQGKHITLAYKDVRTNDGKIRAVLVIASDLTAEHTARKIVERKQQYVDCVMSLFQNRDHAISFIEYVEETAKKLNDYSAVDAKKLDLKKIVHTLKGAARTFHLEDFCTELHTIENTLGSSVQDWENVKKCLARNSKQIRSEFSFIFQESSENQKTRVVYKNQIKQFISKLENGTDGKNTNVKKLFYETALAVPASMLLKQYVNYIQDIAKKLEKKVKPLDLSIADQVFILPEPYIELFRNFVHIFGNSLDHGIEKPDHRILLGKPEEAEIKIVLKKILEAATPLLSIEIEDDGEGLDSTKIIQSALEKGLNISANMKEKEAFQLILESGFSTKNDVSQISGRGVGLSSLKEAVLNLGGTIVVDSIKGQGIKITIRVPLIWSLDTASVIPEQI